MNDMLHRFKTGDRIVLVNMFANLRDNTHGYIDKVEMFRIYTLDRRSRHGHMILVGVDNLIGLCDERFSAVPPP